MIPDFKTYIKESAWGDMMRRSSGEKIRKEDDINILDLDEFYNYLNNTYETLPNHLIIDGTNLIKLEKEDYLSIMLVSDFKNIYRLKFENFSNDDRHIVFSRHPTTSLIYKNLADNYKTVEIIDQHDKRLAIDIKPINGKVSNSLFVELIDFILENSDLKKEIIRKK